MAIWLVTAHPHRDTLEALRSRLESGEIRTMTPFGATLDRSLRGARLLEDGRAVWVEEDYCRPPLAEERRAVLDAHFDEIRVEDAGTEEAGWRRIRHLPRLFPDLQGDPTEPEG